MFKQLRPPPTPAFLQDHPYLNAFLPPIVWGVFIFLLSSQSVLPSLVTSTYDFVFKKCAHMFVYGVFFILMQRAVQITTPESTLARKPYLLWVLPFMATLAYAISDEIHQSFVPGRYPTMRDIGFDMVGAFIAFLKRYDYI